jgi:hypothetical protein
MSRKLTFKPKASPKIIAKSYLRRRVRRGKDSAVILLVAKVDLRPRLVRCSRFPFPRTWKIFPDCPPSTSGPHHDHSLSSSMLFMQIFSSTGLSHQLPTGWIRTSNVDARFALSLTRASLLPRHGCRRVGPKVPRHAVLTLGPGRFHRGLCLVRRPP